MSVARDGGNSESERATRGLLTVETAREDHVQSLSLIGELDLSNVEIAELELQRIENSDSTETVIDLGGLDFMDSTGIRFLVAADARAHETGRALRILPGPPHLQRLFAITGLTERLPFAR